MNRGMDGRVDTRLDILFLRCWCIAEILSLIAANMVNPRQPGVYQKAIAYSADCARFVFVFEKGEVPLKSDFTLFSFLPAIF
jgi:hypothetical protein